jgi:hypothetical protein
MIEHAIDLKSEKKLTEHELSSDYQSCCNLLGELVSSFETTENTDLLYEQGAAYLRLAIYYYICDDQKSHLNFMKKAESILPRADLLALSAQWLDQSNKNPKKVGAFCIAFFESIDDAYEHRDETSKYYHQKMSELTKRLTE